MKKTVIILSAVVLAVSLAIPLNGQVKKQEMKRQRLFKPMGVDKIGVPFINPMDELAKRERYFQARDEKMQKYIRHKSHVKSIQTAKPADATLSLVEDSDHWQADSGGRLVWTAALQNSGTSGATYVRVDIDVYDNFGFYLGTDYNFVWGGANVQLASNGSYTNAIRPNDYGFFRIWTDISYDHAYSLEYTITYENNLYYLANASLDFTSVYYTNASGHLNFYGEVQNESTSYVTYYSIVGMAALNPTATFVEDVDWNYIDGDTYDYSTSAVYPQTIRPFDVTFLFALYNESDGDFMASFEWSEALVGPDTEYPFGTFETPGNYSTVASSIAVTGWALDDTCVASVKIYREEGAYLVYIGDATFVDGARPDIADVYPDYPLNTRAGWGYMLLTNFLPGGGNGYYVLHAIATDVYGDSMDLGTKTIYCDNANAVKPFGAIDTPASGGMAYGNQFNNIGWALTPPPNTIPKNGSTIHVYVDGVKKGNATYNLYRPDIATLFPGYNNSNGAMATFTLNTLPYTNGLHTIFWIASDNAGNADGIGSRFFTISNMLDNPTGLKYKKATMQPFKPTPALMASLPTDIKTAPIRFKKGYRDDIQAQETDVFQNVQEIKIQAMERLEVQIPGVYAGYLAMGGKYKSLPAGSTLDTGKGIFYWQPGPAFLGKYNLVFILKGPDGALTKKNITIAIGMKDKAE